MTFIRETTAPAAPVAKPATRTSRKRSSKKKKRNKKTVRAKSNGKGKRSFSFRPMGKRGTRRPQRPRGKWPIRKVATFPRIIKSKCIEAGWEIVEEPKGAVPNLPGTVADRFSSSLSFFVNGQEQTMENVSPDLKLAHWLRTNGFTGTKIGCGEGGCGACTVLLSSSMHTEEGNAPVVNRSINACLRPVVSLDGMSITTTEGIGTQRKGFHAIQKAIADANGTQCGYCTPGFVMSMYGLLCTTDTPDAQTIEDRFDGNICRCTGYRPILAGLQTFANGDAKAEPPTFPDKLRNYVARPLAHSAEGLQWFSPTTMVDLFSLLKTYADVPTRLVVGNTSIGVAKYYPKSVNDDPSVFIDLTRVPALSEHSSTPDSITFGSAVPLTEVIAGLEADGDRTLLAVARHVKRVANHMVRNVASWAGNLMLAKNHPEFPSDLATVLSAVGATVMLTDAGGAVQRMEIPLLLTRLLPNTAMLTELTIPKATLYNVYDSWKVATRVQNAHPLVNAGFSFTFDVPYDSAVNAPPNITAATLVFGNIVLGPLVCAKTALWLVGKPLNQSTLSGALAQLKDEATPVDPDVPDPTWLPVDKAYRQSLALSLFFKFFATQVKHFGSLPPLVDSVANRFVRPLSSGTEVFTPDETLAPVSMPIPKLAGRLQASGEAKFTADQAPAGSLFGALVQSTMARAKLVSLDASEALLMTGVVDFITAEDIALIGGNNEAGAFPGDEELFASTDVYTVGQSLGLVLADTQAHANAAALKVKVSYASAGEPILTIPDAIEKKSFMVNNEYQSQIGNLKRGDPDAAFKTADQVLEGELYCNDQLHFYMETHSSVVMPGENGVFQARSATQDLGFSHQSLATILGVPQHKVVVTTKRCGGAYGGKLSRNVPALGAVAVAAAKHQKPVSIQLDRNADMNTTGGREGQLSKYKIGFNSDGTIVALQITFYANGGFSYDGTFGDMDMCLLWADNAYNIPNYEVTGVCCTLNRPTTTSMRSPGTVQGSWAMEHLTEIVAVALKTTPMSVREKNFYKDGSMTPYMQEIKYCTLDRVWTQLKSTIDLETLQKTTDQFNASNRWRKRGFQLVPVKYGMGPSGYDEKIWLNVNADGTITTTHTGIEIGQGINTKVAQVIAYELGIPMDDIELFAPSTEKFALATCTGGSGTSESVCGAAIDACTTLKARLQPIRDAHPQASWEELIGFAADAHVVLTVQGTHFGGGEATFDYFVWAAACSVVELDVLSGEIQILRTDIMYDCGQSLNPAVDIGQIEGAFVMGLGYFFTENAVTNSTNGRLITNGTWEYKPPCSKTIPIEFNVTFLDEAKNPVKQATLGSKAVGEPPYILAASAYFAARSAIASARRDAGNTEAFLLDTPLTPEKMQAACLVASSDFVVG